MKNVLTLLTLAILSTAAQAEDSAEMKPLNELENKAEMNSNLWEMLDTNKDGSLSKTEAASSKEIFASWDSLDRNKDNIIDTVEFTQFFSAEN